MEYFELETSQTASPDFVYVGDDDPSVIVDVERLVLDPKKLEQAPDFFRIDRQPRKYVVSERLAARIAALNPTNVSVHRLEQSKS